MKDYELMVIFTPVLSQDEYKAEAKKFSQMITENGGSIVAENFWGLKQLAYPIQKKTTALYYVLEFKSETEFIEKMTVQINRTESIMRYMFTTLDKHAVEYNAKKRNAPAKAEAPVEPQNEEA